MIPAIEAIERGQGGTAQMRARWQQGDSAEARLMNLALAAEPMTIRRADV